MAFAEERDQRHRDIVFLERCPDLSLEEFAGFGFERAAALVAPEVLRFPQPPVAVIELLHQPGQPTGAGLGHHIFNFGCRSRMPQANRSTNGSRKLSRKPLVFANTLAALPAARSLGFTPNTVMCQDRMIPVSSSADHSGSQAGSSNFGVACAHIRQT